MRLNPDCIREVLLCVEEHTGYNQIAVFIDVETAKKISDFLGDMPLVEEYQLKLLEGYDLSELMYHLNYCIKDDLLEVVEDPTAGTVSTLINDLTPKGHQFLADIRHKTVFEKTKSITTELGVESLSSFRKIAESVTSEIVKSYITSI